MMSERLSHRTNTFLPQESVTTALETLYYWLVASNATYLIVVLRRALVTKNLGSSHMVPLKKSLLYVHTFPLSLDMVIRSVA